MTDITATALPAPVYTATARPRWVWGGVPRPAVVYGAIVQTDKEVRRG